MIVSIILITYVIFFSNKEDEGCVYEWRSILVSMIILCNLRKLSFSKCNWVNSMLNNFVIRTFQYICIIKTINVEIFILYRNTLTVWCIYTIMTYQLFYPPYQLDKLSMNKRDKTLNQSLLQNKRKKQKDGTFKKESHKSDCYIVKKNRWYLKKIFRL